MTILPVMFVGLIVFSAVNMGRSRSPMPLTSDAGEDILLDALSISDRSARGIRVVTDADAAAGRAIELAIHAHAPGLRQPLGQRLAIGFGASAQPSSIARRENRFVDIELDRAKIGSAQFR